MKKSFIFLLAILFCIESFGQSTISPDGLVFPNKSLISTTDVVTVPSPALGQSVYNTNAGITGAGASGVGFYSWSGTLWTNGASPLPAGGIVLSTIHPNSALLSAGFGLLGSYVVPNFSTYNAACNVFSPTNMPVSIPVYNTLWSDIRMYGNNNKIFYTNTFMSGVNQYSILDINTDVWKSASTIPVVGGNIADQTAFAMFNNQLHVWGGSVKNTTAFVFIANQKLFKLSDETLNTWSEVPFTLPATYDSRNFSSMISANNKLYVFGGLQTGTLKNDGFIIDPSTGTSIALTPPNTFVARAIPKLFFINNKLIIFGGYKTAFINSSHETYAYGELNDGIIYDFATSTWTAITATNAPAFDNLNGRSFPFVMQTSYTIKEFNNKLYYVGIFGNSTSHTVETKVFDPNTNTWTTLSPLTLAYRLGFGAEIANGKLFIYGGGIGLSGYLNDGAYYDFGTQTWTNFALNAVYKSSGFQMLFANLTNTFYMSGAANNSGWSTLMTKLPDPCFSTPTSTTFYMYNK